MTQTLPTAEVVRRYTDEAHGAPLPAFHLRWPPDLGERMWEFPDGVVLSGPAPRRFGFHLQRLDADRYSLRVLWDRTGLSWPELSRVQLLTSALAPLLSALGTDLWCLLAQPAATLGRSRPRSDLAA